MNILIATKHRNIIGGVETYLRVLIPALLARGHRLALLYDHVETAGATVDPPEAELPAWSSEELEERPALWHELTQWRPDVVYSNRIAFTDTDRRLQESYPVVVYLHDYSGTCTTGRKCHAHRTEGFKRKAEAVQDFEKLYPEAGNEHSGDR